MSYVDDRADAAKALAEAGQSLTLTYPGGMTYDPATGTASGSGGASQTVNGAFFPLSSFRKLSAFRKSVGNIVDGDQQLLLSAQNTSGVAIVAPKVNGTVTDANSNVWTLIAVDPLNPGGTAVLYDCIARRQA